jgi:hypothetical protein
MDRLPTGQQLNRGDELVSARDWCRSAFGTDGSVGIYRTMTRVSALLRRILAQLIARP